jgi:hypothetical protein
MSRDKPRYSSPGHVLIDDRERAGTGREERGGIFIHHTSAKTSVAALQRLGFTSANPMLAHPRPRAAYEPD